MKEKKEQAPSVESRERISIDEFLSTKKLKAEVIAGFKNFVGNVKYDFPDIWENVYDSYINRDNP